jgi:hypothetical protein
LPEQANIPDKLYRIYDKYNINILYMMSYPGASQESKGDDEDLNRERADFAKLKMALPLPIGLPEADYHKILHTATKKSEPSKTAKRQMGIPPKYDWNRTPDDMELGKPREIVRNKKPIVPSQFPPEIYGITAPVDLEAGLKRYDFSKRRPDYDPEKAELGGKATRKANKHRKSNKSKKARKSRKVRKSKKSRKTRK